ncbi:7-cyano-7-deazaguanine synthase, partial [Pseudomonas quasicaspiana]|nr:7-cyano-7-deazaguanine synthase [Pseudomonas quasicaspiana]
VKAGVRLGVDYGLTVSCYQADDQGRACRKCDSCRLRGMHGLDRRLDSKKR